jgi:hypothetical protein
MSNAGGVMVGGSRFMVQRLLSLLGIELKGQDGGSTVGGTAASQSAVRTFYAQRFPAENQCVSGRLPIA